MYFDSKAMEKWFLSLLDFECPICSPFIPVDKLNEKEYMNEYRVSFSSISSLNTHLRNDHRVKVCEVCAKSNRMFNHELKLYNESVFVFIVLYHRDIMLISIVSVMIQLSHLMLSVMLAVRFVTIKSFICFIVEKSMFTVLYAE